MTINIERIERIDKLIQKKATGTPQELSNKLGVCERMVFDYIKEMKKRGAPILFCKKIKSYIYTTSTYFECNFKKIENKLGLQ